MVSSGVSIRADALEGYSKTNSATINDVPTMIDFNRTDILIYDLKNLSSIYPCFEAIFANFWF